MSGHSKGNSPAAAEARFAAALNIGANAWAPQPVAQRCALFALRLYKTYLSVFVGGSCRFQPTCSIYAYEAVERFGVARGSWLALKRLLRCHPLSRKFGFDPVPDATHPSVAVTPEEAHS